MRSANNKNNKENKEALKVAFEHSKNSLVQKKHLQLVAYQKISLIPKKIAPPPRKNPHQDQPKNELTIKGDSLIKHKPSFSTNKYTFKANTVKPLSPLLYKPPVKKPSIVNKKANKSQIEDRDKRDSKAKNEHILKFGEILNIYEMEDKNVNVNEEIDKFLKKLEKEQVSAEDFELIFGLDWFDIKSSNSFEVLIDKMIEICLRTNNPKDVKSFHKMLVCFILNGVEEFMFFEGITPTIFTNFIKIPFHFYESLDFVMVFLLRNSKKLYFFSEEKLEFLIKVLMNCLLQNENLKVNDENFFHILQISENLLQNAHVRMTLFKNFSNYVRKLSQNCRDIYLKSSTLILKNHLMEINILLINLKYPDFFEKISREEIIFNIISKLNSSLKIQREFPTGIILTFKKIRKILTNYRLWETKSLDFESIITNLSKINVKGLLVPEFTKTYKKTMQIKPFLTKKK